MTTTTYKVRPERLPALVEKLEKLAKRAQKLGVAAPTWTVGPLQTKVVRNPDELSLQTTKVLAWHDVELTSEPVKLAGWTFLATLDHASEAGVILRTVPGQTVPVSYRTAKPVCDHCGFDRRRKETFVVVNDDGAYKQVGRQCLRDFMGVDPTAAAQLAEMQVSLAAMLDDEDGFAGSGGGVGYLPIEGFLALTAVVIRTDGWVSRKAARERGDGAATADWVLTLATSWADDVKKWLRDHPVTDADMEKAKAALEWARTIREREAGELSDYLHNRTVVAAGEAIRPKDAGLAASMIPAYDRWLGVETQKRMRVGANSVHFGTVGKRETFTLTPVDFKQFESNFGVRTLVKFTDAAGNVAVWWTGEPSDDFERGVAVTVKATVKEHSDYNGTKQTVLTRVAPVVSRRKRIEAAQRASLES